MALVMLPCDLPWWGSVQKYLNKIAATKNTHELIEAMQKIHDMCCVSLDPEEEPPDPEQFIGLTNFLDNDLTSEERSLFFNKTLPAIVSRAMQLKEHKPRGGLHFSLQQQPDFVELPRTFISSLVANAFFSTFPKRTDKSHPTLQNFNFGAFFKHLTSNVQKSKLRSFLHYFDWLELEENATGTIKFFRQVMTSKEWLTIEDWLECTLPLCPLQIRHEGRLERAENDNLQVCFSSTKLGGNVLGNGQSQECINFCTIPEIFSVLLNVESLEDNEIFRIENVAPVSRIIDPKNRAVFEKNDTVEQISMCCMDADDYSTLPLGQYVEDNVLRELNKCLLAFQQKPHRVATSTDNNHSNNTTATLTHKLRRLSPIGESLSAASSTAKSDNNHIPIITQQSCSTRSGGSISPHTGCSMDITSGEQRSDGNSLCVKLEYGGGRLRQPPARKADTSEAAIAARRGRFIVLGSSGECLPVNRSSSCGGGEVMLPVTGAPLAVAEPASVESSEEEEEEDEFHSAQTSLEDPSEDEDFHKRYSIELETPERRSTFAQRLRDALRRETSSLTTTTATTSSDESSYAVGISVTGSALVDPDIKVRRRGSSGFILQEDSLDEDFLNNSLQQEKQWIDKFRSKQSQLSRKESNKSSEYSFSTDYSSTELEEVYEQFSRWLDDPHLTTPSNEPGQRSQQRPLNERDLAVVQFAGALLKRTLSESFAGVPIAQHPADNYQNQSSSPDVVPAKHAIVSHKINHQGKQKLVLSAKSLSLELARHKHKLAAQLSQQVEPIVIAAAVDDSQLVPPPATVQVVSEVATVATNNLLVAGNSLVSSSASRIPSRPRLNWVATCVTAVVQTLEDICVNITTPTVLTTVLPNTKLSQIAQRHRFTASDGSRPPDSPRPVATGNWGCGATRHGHVQLKVLIQWLAASVAGAPALVYYTCGHRDLATLDTVCRLLVDRRWTVRDLAEATLKYAGKTLEGGKRDESASTLFEELIGVAKRD